MKNELISVIIPVYNCEKYVGEAIESVLAQTYHPIEIIVIDDGSTDNSSKVVKNFKDPIINYHYQKNKGLGAARNQGVSLSKGNYIAFLDSDDVWMPEKLSLQMDIFLNSTEIDMMFGHVIQFYSPDLYDKSKLRKKNIEEKFSGHCAGTMVIKKESFHYCGNFATNWIVGEFVDWYSKAKEKNLKEFVCPEVLVKRRIHDDNMGVREKKSQVDYVRILKAALDRRRKQ